MSPRSSQRPQRHLTLRSSARTSASSALKELRRVRRSLEIALASPLRFAEETGNPDAPDLVTGCGVQNLRVSPHYNRVGCDESAVSPARGRSPPAAASLVSGRRVQRTSLCSRSRCDRGPVALPFGCGYAAPRPPRLCVDLARPATEMKRPSLFPGDDLAGLGCGAVVHKNGNTAHRRTPALPLIPTSPGLRCAPGGLNPLAR